MCYFPANERIQEISLYAFYPGAINLSFPGSNCIFVRFIFPFPICSCHHVAPFQNLFGEILQIIDERLPVPDRCQLRRFYLVVVSPTTPLSLGFRPALPGLTV